MQDILDAGAAIARFLSGVAKESFIGDDLIRSAVLQKLLIIGEATSKLPSQFTDRHPEIPWRDIVGFRNIAIHSYFAVNWSIVWVAATEETPMLCNQISAILVHEFSSDD